MGCKAEPISSPSVIDTKLPRLGSVCGLFIRGEKSRGVVAVSLTLPARYRGPPPRPCEGLSPESHDAAAGYHALLAAALSSHRISRDLARET